MWTERKTERREVDGSVVMFLIYNNGQFLVEERIRLDSSHKGFFIIPAGHVDEGETPEQTVLRETSEEHGITPSKIIKLDSFENMSLGGDFLYVDAYLITEYVGDLINREPEKCNLHWMTPQEAEDKMVLASSRLVLFKALEALSSQGL